MKILNEIKNLLAGLLVLSIVLGVFLSFAGVFGEGPQATVLVSLGLGACWLLGRAMREGKWDD